MMLRNHSFVLLVALVAVSAACSSDPMSPPTGQVNVLLTDAPIDLSQVKEVRVTLEEMRLFPTGEDDADESGMEMNGPISGGKGLTLNLLDYQNGETVMIAGLDVPQGDYRKLRMTITEASLVTEDPDDPLLEIVEPIFVPSSKVDIPVNFSVSGGETTDVTLDFDAALSVQVNETSGNHPYILRPVITPVSVNAH